MLISASNYLVFAALARLLSRQEFVGFSTAVGLNMLAFALAEGGVSYVAPRDLAARGPRSGALAGAFVGVSLGLYAATMAVGFVVWNGLGRDPLDPRWVLAYAAYFAPALLIPSWVTCWSIDLAAVIGLGLMRGLMVGAVLVFPTPEALAGCGALFLATVLLLILRLNSRERVLDWSDRSALRVAVGSLRQVFLARTMSYAVYGLVPLAVGAIRGNGVAAAYVAGERLKSLYATLFQPLVQTAYLGRFQSRPGVASSRTAEFGLHALNIVTAAAAVWAAGSGLFALAGDNLASVPHLALFIVAAGASVATGAILFFRVFPSGKFDVFRRASFTQMLTFAALLGALPWSDRLAPAHVLLGAEAVFLVAVGGQVAAKRWSMR
jgi:hypothetical protein